MFSMLQGFSFEILKTHKRPQGKTGNRLMYCSNTASGHRQNWELRLSALFAFLQQMRRRMSELSSTAALAVAFHAAKSATIPLGAEKHTKKLVHMVSSVWTRNYISNRSESQFPLASYGRPPRTCFLSQPEPLAQPQFHTQLIYLYIYISGLSVQRVSFGLGFCTFRFSSKAKKKKKRAVWKSLEITACFLFLLF